MEKTKVDLKEIGKWVTQLEEKQRHTLYTIDKVQMGKLVDIVNIFGVAGLSEPVTFEQMGEGGGITARFVLFNLVEKEIERFADAIKYASALSIDVEMPNKISIGVTVPGIFVPKK